MYPLRAELCLPGRALLRPLAIPLATFAVATHYVRNTSTRDVVSNVSNAQIAAIRRWSGEWINRSNGDIRLMTTRRPRKTKVTVRIPWRANGPSADKKPCPRRVKAANGPLWPSRRLDPIPRPWGWGAGRSLILDRVKRRHRSWCRIGRLAECRAGDERDRRRTGKVVSRCPHALSGLKSSRPPPQASPPLVAQARVPAPMGRAGLPPPILCD